MLGRGYRTYIAIALIVAVVQKPLSLVRNVFRIVVIHVVGTFVKCSDHLDGMRNQQAQKCLICNYIWFAVAEISYIYKAFGPGFRLSP